MPLASLGFFFIVVALFASSAGRAQGEQIPIRLSLFSPTVSYEIARSLNRLDEKTYLAKGLMCFVAKKDEAVCSITQWRFDTLVAKALLEGLASTKGVSAGSLKGGEWISGVVSPNQVLRCHWSFDASYYKTYNCVLDTKPEEWDSADQATSSKPAL